MALVAVITAVRSGSSTLLSKKVRTTTESLVFSPDGMVSLVLTVLPEAKNRNAGPLSIVILISPSTGVSRVAVTMVSVLVSRLVRVVRLPDRVLVQLQRHRRQRLVVEDRAGRRPLRSEYGVGRAGERHRDGLVRLVDLVLDGV